MPPPTLSSLACIVLLWVGACRTPEPAPARPDETDSAPAVGAEAPVDDEPVDEAPAEGETESAPEPGDPLADWSSGVGRRGTSNDGAWRIQYRTRPEAIPLNDEFGLDVAVFDRDGKLAPDVDLVVDAAMPHHRHGMLQAPTIEPRDDGTFHVEGLLFHMPGYWELYFDVTVDGITERTQFVVELD